MKSAYIPAVRSAKRSHQLGGSALLAVFWAVIVLTMAVASWFFWLQQRLQLHGEETRDVEALAMAHSGVAVAMNPKVDRYSSLLQAEVAPGVGYRVTIEGEAGRLNLLWILTGNVGKRIALFKQWLEFVIGVNPLDRDRLLDCLMDYVDADNIARPNGQEDNKDYHPANRMLQSLDELRRIPGMEPLLAYTGWEELVTLESPGPVDLLEAPEEILRLLPGFGEVQVQRWLQRRAGLDQILHTEDDPKYSKVEDVLDFLGLDKNRKDAVKDLCAVGEPIIRIRSEGYSGKVVRQVQVVVRKGTGTPQISSWIE